VTKQNKKLDITADDVRRWYTEYSFVADVYESLWNWKFQFFVGTKLVAIATNVFVDFKRFSVRYFFDVVRQCVSSFCHL